MLGQKVRLRLQPNLIPKHLVFAQALKGFDPVRRAVWDTRTLLTLSLKTSRITGRSEDTIGLPCAIYSKILSGDFPRRYFDRRPGPVHL